MGILILKENLPELSVLVSVRGVDMKIMFVCTANTSRSAMAEEIFKKLTKNDVEVYSCGVSATTGKKSSPKTINVCKSHGIDLRNHRATNFRDANIKDMDLVLTFERYHKERVEIYYPNLKICTIMQFIGEYPPDIPDPVGGDFHVYDACFCEICRVLKKVKSRLFD